MIASYQEVNEWHKSGNKYEIGYMCVQNEWPNGD